VSLQRPEPERSGSKVKHPTTDDDPAELALGALLERLEQRPDTELDALLEDAPAALREELARRLDELAATGLLPDAAALRPGSVLAGRYEILALAGLGGMGRVYRAHDRGLERTVAIKLLRRPDRGGPR